MFEVVPKKNVFERVIKPVRKMFMKEDKPEKVKGKTKESVKKENKVPVVLAWGAVCSACVAGGMWWKRNGRR